MTDTPQPTAFRDAFAAVSERLAGLIARARSDVRVYANDLDARLYAAEPVLEATRAFLLRGPTSHFAILIRDEGRLRVEGNRLVDLLKRLPSRASVRVTRPEDTDLNEDLLVVDDHTYYYPLRRDPPAEPVESRRDAIVLAKRLAEAWEFAEPSAEFRQFTV